MLGDINLPLIMVAALIATISPGPATLAIAGTSMASGRRAGCVLAAGIFTGSCAWSLSAALGLAAVMVAHGWIIEMVRYGGAAYLLFLGVKSALAAIRNKPLVVAPVTARSLRRTYMKGLLLHLTNPKAILFFGSLFAVGVPPGTPVHLLGGVIVAVACQSLFFFMLCAVVFSSPPAVAFYIRMRRPLEAGFALAFGAAGLKILTARLD